MQNENNMMQKIRENNEQTILRRKTILIEHFRKFIDETYVSFETNIYVESIDAYLFHCVIDMKLSNSTNRRAIDSFVIRFRSYSHDEFDKLSTIYAWMHCM